jgi:putative transposase
MQTKTLKLRIKDKHSAFLGGLAREVNMLWNYINETSYKAARPFSGPPKWLSGYDLQKLVAGATKGEDGLAMPSQTLQQVCEEYATRRKQFKKVKLNWRVSNPKSSKRSLGWVPFKKGAVVYRAGQVRFAGKLLNLWDSYGLNEFELCGGSFSQDSRGRWYLNVCVQVETATSTGITAVGIDLGLKECAVLSDGQRLEGRWFRKHEEPLALAQQRDQKKRARSLHAKIKNKRKDELHKFSTAIVKQNAAVFVGNLASSKLVKTKMAKSTLDAGWAMFKTMLEYKCRQAGVVFEEVNEAYTTQTCSCCGSIPASSPKGRAGLNERVWVCSDCATGHDRDVNAATNIRAVGLGRLAEGIPVL